MKENKNRKELQVFLAERPASLWTLPVAPVRGTAVGRFERTGSGFFQEGFEARQGSLWAFVSGDGEGTLAGRIII